MEDRVYMRELSRQLDRSSTTIRGWERDGILPKALRPHRDDKGWRYWTPRQVVLVKAWMVERGMAPGKGLPGFDPDDERVQGMLEQLRRPRDIEPVDCPACGMSTKNLAAHTRLAHPAAA